MTFGKKEGAKESAPRPRFTFSRSPPTFGKKSDESTSPKFSSSRSRNSGGSSAGGGRRLPSPGSADAASASASAPPASSRFPGFRRASGGPRKLGGEATFGSFSASTPEGGAYPLWRQRERGEGRPLPRAPMPKPAPPRQFTFGSPDAVATSLPPPQRSAPFEKPTFFEGAASRMRAAMAGFTTEAPDWSAASASAPRSPAGGQGISAEAVAFDQELSAADLDLGRQHARRNRSVGCFPAAVANVAPIVQRGGDVFFSVRVQGETHNGNALSFGCGGGIKASYGDGFGRSVGTVGLHQNCEASAEEPAVFANSLGDRTAEAPIQFRVETGMTLSLSITFNGNPQGPGTASFFVNTDCVGQVEVTAAQAAVVGCTLNTDGAVEILPPGSEGTPFSGSVTAAEPKEPEATSWTCGQCALECAVAYAACPACGAARDGTAGPKVDEDEPLPELPPEPSLSFKCKLYVWNEAASKGSNPWSELCLGDAVPKATGSGPVLEMDARTGVHAGTKCYRHKIARGVNTLEGPASNLLCWTAVDESGLAPKQARRYLAKFENAGYAKVFQKEYRRLQCAC